VNLIESGQAAKYDEACHRRGSNGHVHTSSSPGCKGTARGNRSVEEPGRPGEAGASVWPQRGEGRHNLVRGNGRRGVARNRGRHLGIRHRTTRNTPRPRENGVGRHFTPERTGLRPRTRSQLLPPTGQLEWWGAGWGRNNANAPFRLRPVCACFPERIWYAPARFEHRVPMAMSHRPGGHKCEISGPKGSEH